MEVHKSVRCLIDVLEMDGALFGEGVRGWFRQLVLHHIAKFANADGTHAFPNEERLAKKVNATKRGIRKAIRDLERMGFLQTEHSRGRVNRYIITTPEPGFRPVTEEPRNGCSALPRNRCSPDPGTGVPNPGTGVPPTVLPTNRPTTLPEANEQNEENEMSVNKKKVREVFYDELNKEVPDNPKTWSRFKLMTKGYTVERACEVVEGWCERVKGQDWVAAEHDILAAFCNNKGADGQAALRSNVAVQMIPVATITRLFTDLHKISDSKVVFNKTQQNLISPLLGVYTPGEILGTYRKYYAVVEGDDYQMRFAARTFAGSAESLVGAFREAQAEEQAIQARRERIIAQANAEAEAERARPAPVEEEEERDLETEAFFQ